MKAGEITEEVLKALDSGDFRLNRLNYVTKNSNPKQGNKKAKSRGERVIPSDSGVPRDLSDLGRFRAGLHRLARVREPRAQSLSGLRILAKDSVTSMALVRKKGACGSDHRSARDPCEP